MYKKSWKSRATFLIAAISFTKLWVMDHHIRLHYHAHIHLYPWFHDIMHITKYSWIINKWSNPFDTALTMSYYVTPECIKISSLSLLKTILGKMWKLGSSILWNVGIWPEMLSLYTLKHMTNCGITGQLPGK